MKKILILTLAALFVFNGCSNKGETKEEIIEEVKKEVLKEITKEATEEKTEYFDFTVTDIVSEIQKSSIVLTPISVVDSKETGEKIATYTSQKDTFTTDENVDYPLMHYSIAYDDTTGKVSDISFFLDTNSENGYKRFFVHIYNTVSSLEMLYTDFGEDWTELGEVENIGSTQYFTYQGKHFGLLAFQTENYCNASFTPNQTKGE